MKLRKEEIPFSAIPLVRRQADGCHFVLPGGQGRRIGRSACLGRDVQRRQRFGFCPSVFMPSSGTLCQRVPNGAYMADFDVGEMFHNYMMHPPDVPYHGVNLPSELWEEAGSKHALWGRLTMGFKPSPYIACRIMARALEFARGPPDEVDSPFAFSQVVLILPGSLAFDPTQSWVQKLTRDGLPLGDVVAFMDDGRPIGRDEADAAQCTRQICARLQFLGFRMPHGSGGAWDSVAAPGPERWSTRTRDLFGASLARSAGIS